MMEPGEMPVVVCELGPFGVRVGDAWTPIRGRRSATVLGLLAMDPLQARSIDQLVEAGWSGSDRPANARKSLINVVSRMRKAYGGAFIASEGMGYRLGADVASERLRFLRTVDETADILGLAPAKSLALTDRGLAEWRGVPWTDLDDIDEFLIDRSLLIQAHYRLRSLRGAGCV